ncbi:MAG: ferritin [Myxococcota bacterium]
MGSEYHEPREALSAKTLDVKRAIDSMMEELEAVDWYRQRREAATDPQLRAILDHHQREEIEHFAMLLEWMRRNDSDFGEQLREYLFTEDDIVSHEEAGEGEPGSTEGGAEAPPAQRESLRRTIGGLKEGK